MVQTATIEHDGCSLTFFSPSNRGSDEWYDFDVAVAMPGLTGRVNVPSLGPSVAPFFEELSKLHDGWNGPKEYQSIEGDLHLSATINRLGHITCMVELGSTCNQGWRINCKILIDCGAQLTRFVAELNEIFPW